MVSGLSFFFLRVVASLFYAHDAEVSTQLLIIAAPSHMRLFIHYFVCL